MRSFELAVLALGALDSVLLAVLAWRRIRTVGSARRRELLERRLRPVALAFLEGDADLPGLGPREQEVLADTLGAYARKLRGPASARIAGYFESAGVVNREIAALAGARASWRRAAAAQRLGGIGSTAAEGPLVAALSDRDRGVRTAAARSLGRLRCAEAVEPLLAASATASIPAAVAAWAALQIGPVARPGLRRLMAAGEPAQRAAAIQVLALVGDASDGVQLAGRLGDGSATVRAAAAQGLARLGGPRDFDGLLTALDDRVPAVRVAAATALGRLRDKRALVGLLGRALGDQFEVAQAAAHAAAAIDLETCARMAESSASRHLGEAVDLARLA